MTADLTGDVTGTVSSLSNHTTDGLSEASEGATNLYFTESRARASVSVSQPSGDGSIAYNSSTGVITYTGPSAAETKAISQVELVLLYQMDRFLLDRVLEQQTMFSLERLLPI